MAGDLTRVQSNGLLDASKSGLLNRDRPCFHKDLPLTSGGGPWHEIAAYLALKPNVWVDISSMAFVYPTREFARILRTHLTFVPQKVLFGTDAGGSSECPTTTCTIFCSRAPHAMRSIWRSPGSFRTVS